MNITNKTINILILVQEGHKVGVTPVKPDDTDRKYPRIKHYDITYEKVMDADNTPF